MNDVTPFRYNRFLSACKQNCIDGHYNKIGQSDLAAGEVFDDQCNYYNCKNWNPTDNTTGNNSKRCTECWNQTDVSNYDRWPAKEAYTQKEIYGIDTATPFTLKEDHSCKMNCKQHYWSNSNNSAWNDWHLASEPNEQRCTHSNCKTFNWADETVLPYQCN